MTLDRRPALAALLVFLAACGTPDLGERLRRAATQGDRRQVQDLIAKGAAVDAADEDGWTPLLWAAAHGNEDTVGALLDAGADRRAATIRERQNALILAARWNRAEVVATLIRRGADVAQRDSIGWPALMWASLKGRTDVVKVLLDGGARVNMLDSDRNTPLILAARQGRLETVKLLLSRGARPDLRNADGDDAESLARKSGYPAVAGLIAAAR